MHKKQYGISDDVLPVFDSIMEANVKEFGEHLVGVKCFEPEWDDEFSKSLVKHLSKEQRFHLYEKNGACNGTGYDKVRKEFAVKNADIPLSERIHLFCELFGRDAVLNEDDNTISVNFACTHGYYKRAREGKYKKAPASIEYYFERCAGGRLYEYERALGIKLKIKSVDVSSLNDDVLNPVTFVFDIVG
jgi:hypothetical protein